MVYSGINSVFSITGDLGATIMHQYAARANKIRVQVFDFEVIDCYRTFKQFVLYLFDSILSPFTVTRISPARRSIAAVHPYAGT